jgi:hypothetical protein
MTSVGYPRGPAIGRDTIVRRGKKGIKPAGEFRKIRTNEAVE